MRGVKVGIVVVGVLALGACSSSGDGSSRESGAGSQTAAPAKDAPLAVVPVAESSGCGATTAAAAGHTKETMSAAGEERWYYRDVPSAHDGTTPVPLVLDFHGYSEGAEIHLEMSKLASLGESEGFVTLTPQGTGPVARWDTTLGSKDLGFVGELLDSVESDLCIDTNRVYSTGLSNGAFMTSAVACAYNDRIAAVAPVAGVRTIEGCEFARPVPIVAFHGTDDGYVSFTGGLGEDALDLPAPDGSGKSLRETLTADQLKQSLSSKNSIPNIMAGWAKRNGCAPGDGEASVAADVVEVTYDCTPDAVTKLYRVEGGGHTWPGSQFSQAIVSIVGPTTMNINANEIMWKFFMDHPLRAATN